MLKITYFRLSLGTVVGFLTLSVLIPNTVFAVERKTAPIHKSTQQKITTKRLLNLPPDLLVERIRLNKECRVVVRFKNAGPGPIPAEAWSTPVQFYYNDEVSGGVALSGIDKDKKLKLRGGYVDYVRLSDPLRIKRRTTVKVVIDPANSFKEADENNNTGSRSLICQFGPKPDLAISNISLDSACNIVTTLENRSKNGRIPDSAYVFNNQFVQFYYGDEAKGGENLAGFDTNHQLQNPGGRISFTRKPIFKLGGGKVQVKARVYGAVEELTMANNEMTKTLECNPGFKRQVPLKNIDRRVLERK